MRSEPYMRVKNTFIKCLEPSHSSLITRDCTYIRKELHMTAQMVTVGIGTSTGALPHTARSGHPIQRGAAERLGAEGAADMHVAARAAPLQLRASAVCGRIELSISACSRWNYKLQGDSEIFTVNRDLTADELSTNNV